MTVLDALGYEYKSANGFQKMMKGVAASKVGSAMFSRTLPFLDKALFTLTSGKSTATSLFSGLPVLWLTTTGARSGRPRTSPVLGIPAGETVALVGSNWGGDSTPAWVHNLTANPLASVRYRDRSAEVEVRTADQREADEVFEKAGTLYQGYQHYRERAGDRTIKVFVLESAPPESS